MASPPSSVILESKYDVFLSFRGEDTRLNFTSHLYAALCRQNVATFIDSENLRIGDNISPVLLKAIEDSKVSVIIFSKNYASSTWCLEELEKILQCMKSKGQIVVPVFYHIDPSEVPHQIGSFEESFGKHDARFKNMPEKVQIWRAALTEAANISGKHLAENKPESELVEEIVRDILNGLTDMSPLSVTYNDLVGIDRHIKQINSLLMESNVVGIWGMGGIGKTTIVEALFNQISRDFDSCCFINVGKQLEKHHDQLVDLQWKTISKILRKGDCNIDIPNAIPQLTKERLRRKKFLIVLDDVNNFEHLEFLVKGLEPLHIKSRIIIISRDKQVLSCCEENHIYEVEGLNYDEAPLLFYKYAFKEYRVPEHLQQLSKMIITYAKGHPLALKVLGSLLHRKSKEAWESVVLNVKEIIDPKILDVLKISYDGLTDTEKSMFLFIASFLNWESKVVAEKILKAYFKPMEYCFEVLINKALIKTSNNRLQMHDLLLEMGRKIVRKEYEYKPEEHRRLLDKDDVRHVLQNNKFSSMASSSSSVILKSKYDVFLSFRGEDTRYGFTSHLYSALIREDIAPFINDDINTVLLEAIQDCKISVIIFSENYASSRWCLDELSNIVECRKSTGQVVIPVFYHIDPSDVRKQTGHFGDAFDKLHKRFAGTPERVHKWRAALTEAANLSGYDLTWNRSESKLIEEIVRDILKILTNISPLSDNYDDLVGIDRRIAHIIRLQIHDLLLKMGRKIVHKENKYKPEKCRRLLDNDDVRHVLQNNKFSSMASSSSSVILESKHDVFLSFRGKDTRHSFTSHLYSALIKEDIAPFIDADLEKGYAIPTVLLEEIQDSKISVIIFSENYASSIWCLEELSNIVECRKSKGQVVIPVFYRIDPSDVRKQTGRFGTAFDQLRERFAGTPERVHKWRAALTEAANLSGDHLTENRSESKLIEEIVRDIRKILTNMSPLSDNYDDLVGIDRRITQINWLLKKSSIVGIWGVRGIGKTTIVEALCKQISRDFDSCCFINFGKQLEKHHDRLVDLQREIISRILGEGNNVIEISNAIPQLTKERLRRKKFIIVLDDVNNFEHLEFLIKGLQPLHEKSRIIITTRDKQVLSCEGNNTYEVEGLKYEEAPLLFYKYAFKEYSAPEQLQQLSEMIIAYAKGNPLALKVLGSFLYRKSKEAWKSVVHNLEEIADVKILDILKVSYIGLDNT